MKKTITLETERLILRKLEENDYKAIFDNWASDPVVSKHLTWNTHKNYDVTKEILKIWLNEYEKDYTFRWIVTLKEDGTPIGMIDVMSVNLAEGKAEIGYCYGQKWWGNGFATEALRKVLEYVSVEIEYLYARHERSNPASGRAMQKAGMEFAGTLKMYSKTKEQREDTDFYYYISKRK